MHPSSCSGEKVFGIGIIVLNIVLASVPLYAARVVLDRNVATIDGKPILLSELIAQLHTKQSQAKLSLLLNKAMVTATLKSDAFENELKKIVNDSLAQQKILPLPANTFEPFIQKIKLSASEKSKFSTSINSMIKQWVREELETLENELVLGLHCKKIGIDAAPDEVEKYVEGIRKPFGTRENFVKALHREGLTEKVHRAQVVREIRKMRDIQRDIKNKVSEKEIETAFKRKQLTSPDEYAYHLKQVLFAPHQKAAAYAYVKSFKKQKNVVHDLVGVDGATVTDLQKVDVDDWEPAIAQKIIATAIGGVSEPVMSTQGWHVFFVKEKVKLDKKPIEEAVKAAYEKQVEHEWEMHLQELRGQAHVDVFL